jgi:hypothetical protein
LEGEILTEFMTHLHIEHPIGWGRIATVLNVEPPTTSSERAFWDRYVASNGMISRTEYRTFAAQLLSKRLRNYVDAWMDTGLGADGFERPSSRTVPLRAHVALTQHLADYPPVCYFDPDRGWVISIGSTHGQPRGPGQLSPAVDAEAQRLLFVLVAGDLDGCLCKCRHSLCGRYYILAKPRTQYKTGTYCRLEHQRSAKAALCMRQKRHFMKSRLVEIAATRLRQRRAGPEWQADCASKLILRDHIRQVARKDNSLRDFRYMGVHWITRNQRLIEQKRGELCP